MKRLFILLISIMFTTFLSSQTVVVFSEDFELPSLGDSVLSSSDPIGAAPWAITTNLKNSGLRADSSMVQPSATTYLTTNSFSTVGYSKVFLKFAQICKILFQDGGTVQYSTDGGNNWQIVSSTLYLGSGVMALDKFSENTHSTSWYPGDTLTKPTNSWWKTETFDLSSILSNQASIKLRFRMADGGIVGGEGRYGWLLDDIKVLASNNELTPPTMSFKSPVYSDTVYVTGPFTIQAYVKDSSGISNVQLVYNVNGGNDVVLPMVNVSDSTYTADIPSFAYNNTISYRINASDIYNNSASLPSGGSKIFFIKKGAPSVQVGTTTTTGLFSPIYIASSTSTYLYSYNVCLFEKNEILSGGTIESLAFNKTDAQGYSLGNATLKIYIKGVDQNYAPGTYSDYVAMRNGALKVYENTAQNLNTAAGWQTFMCNTGSLFNYSGSENLLVFIEWYRPGNATGAVNWQINTAAGKANTFYGAGSVPDLSNTTGQRSNIKFNFQSSNAAIDATLLNFASPVNPMTANISTPVSVRVKNLGSTTLTGVEVHWAVDGVYQGLVDWVGNLPQDFVSSALVLGNVNLTVGPHTLKAWTNLPNGVTDQETDNDTIIYSIFACENLTGTFTVGTPTSNFPTLADVFTALNNCGISGPVTFKLAPATYNQQLILPLFNNVSATNTITFESATGNPNDVVFQYNATGTADNFVLKFYASNYIKVKNIKFKSLNATNGRVVEFANGASYNTLEGCKIEMMPATVSTVTGIYNVSSTFEHRNTIKNNNIQGGYYGIYFYGASATKEMGNIFEGNIINNFYYYGLYLYYQDSTKIIGNTISNPINTTAYGLYNLYMDNANVLKNRIIMNAATTNYCMYFSSNNSSAGNSLIANNFVSQSVSTGTVYGIYNTGSNRMRYYHNSVNITGGSATAYGFYISATSGIHIKNNSFSNTGGGYAYYISSTTAVDSSDNNNIYATGSNYAYWGALRSNLAALQAASGKDQNSISINPLYYSVSDLHTDNVGLYAKGTSIDVVTDDIDGQLRDTIPCIGADEFIALPNDAKIKALYTYGKLPLLTATPHQVKTIIKNMGSNTLTNLDVTLNITGSNTFTNVKTIATLLPASEDTITFDAFTPTTLGLNNVKLSIPTDDNLTDNELNYRQEITTDAYAYADTSAPATSLGFNTASGLFVAKYFINDNKLVSKVKAFITSSNTVGKRIYAVVLNQNGVLVDSSYSRIITASDTNTWVTFTMLNPSASLTSNNNVYVGIAQTSNPTSGYYPLGCQKETPARRGSFYFTTNLAGGALTETTQNGRFMLQADLIIPSANDARLVGIISPNTNCGLTNETVKIKIQNAGVTTIYGDQNVITANYAVISNGNLTNIVTEQITDTILPLQNKEFTFLTPIDLLVSTLDSNFKIIAWTDLLNDNIHVNDSVVKMVKSMYTPQPPIINSPVSAAIGTSVVLNAISNDTVNWYANIIDTVTIATGNNFTTPLIFNSKTYYVSASRGIVGSGGGGATQYVGEVAPLSTAGTGGGLTTYVNFTALTNFTLKTVDLFPYGTGAGTVTIELRTSTGTPIMSKTFNVTGTTSPLSPAQTVTLDFQIPGGASYRLGVNSWTGGVTNLYRDLTGTYPYTAPGIMTIDGTSLSPYFYFFYHWGVFAGYGSGSTSSATCSSTKIPYVVNAISGVDASVTEIITPKTGCNLINQTVKLKIKNKGNLPIIGGQNTLTAGYGVKLAGNIINVVTQNVNDTIQAFDSIQFSFNTPVDLPSAGLDSNYTIVAWTQLVNDLNINNDTLNKNLVSKYVPQPPTVITPVNIGFGNIAVLSASAADTIKWYANYADTVALYTGASYTTPVLYDTTTYWARATTSMGSNTNLALSAVATHGGGGASPSYGPELYNNGVIPAYGTTGTGLWGWTNTNSWIEFTWTAPVTFNKVKFHKDTRAMTTCTFQYWNGSAYVNFYNYNSTVIDDSVTFPSVTSSKIRFNTIAGASNPSFREIQVFEAMILGCQSNPIAVVVNVAPGKDAFVSKILTPATGCGLNNQEVKVKIKNIGNLPILSSQNALTAHYGLKVNGSIINVVNQQVTVDLMDSDSIDFSFNTLLTLPANGADSNYTLVAWINLVNDLNINNDTTFKSVLSKYTPPSPTVSNVTIPYGNTATFNIATTDSIYWFANLTDTIPLASGNQFTTPALYDTTTYYVVAGQVNTASNLIYVGEVAPLSTAGTGGGLSTYVNFTALTNFTLKTIDLFPYGTGAGTVTIELRTSTGTPIMSKLVNVTGTNSPLSPAQTVTLDFPVPGGASYRLGVNSWTGGVTNLYRDLTGTYPYVAPGIMTIDGTSLSPYFYFFYNWGVYAGFGSSSSAGGCTSAKVPATAIVTNIPALDIAVTSVTEPSGSITSGVVTPVKVALTNYGTTTVTSATINWSVNGILQTAVPFTGLNLTNGQTSSPLSLGDYTFAGGPSVIKAWSSLPNNQTDMYPVNDSISANVMGCLTGTFTVGTGGTFANFNAAMNAISMVGICGNVIFDVLPGTYNENLTINQIPNMGPNATITFRSQNNTNTSVILTSASGSAVVNLNGTDYMRFEKISIIGTGTIPAAVQVAGGASNNIFNGNIIEIPAATSSTYRVINSSSAALDNYNQFINNRISGGYYAIYWYGSSSMRKVGSVFNGNTINNFYYYGLYLYYSDSTLVTKNSFANAANSGAVYGLYSSYTNNSIFTKNKVNISGSSTAYCMYLNYNNSTTGNSLVANNFVSQSNGTAGVYGLYNYYSNNMNYYHNSVSVTAGSTSAYAFYSSSGSANSLFNNIFSNTGGGYAFYVATPAGIDTSNYNDFYATGTNLAYWTSAHTTLASLKTASGKDQNSYSVNPNFFATNNLHIVNFDLDGKAKPLSVVTDDIDDDVRNTTTPDIGADEFVLPDNDAGIVNLLEPVNPTTIGLQNVKVRVKNFGQLALSTVNIHWSVNGVLQTPYPWLCNIAYGGNDTISIGMYNFTAGANNMKFWSEMPNGVPDQLSINDTLNISIITCAGPLSGNYTIGGTNPDFQTINNAIQSLTYCGVNGPVIFNIQAGNYNEQISIPAINGASDTNTITFKSQNNDSSSVIINFNPISATNNYVVRLNGADYIKFKYLTISNPNATLGRVVELTNSASNNEFSNNVIQAALSTTSTSAGIYSYNTIDNNNLFANNLITGGYYGVYLYGVSTSSKELGNTIINNIIKDFYYYGLYLYYQDSVTAIGNTIRNAATSATVYGLYSYYADNNNYQKNKIILTNSGTTYALYLSNNAGGSSLIANNFISQSVSLGTVYGFYSTTSSNLKIYHNSISTYGSTSYYSMYFTGGANNILRNNSVVNNGGGYAIYAASTTSIASSDYNNFFTTGTKLGYWGAACANLAAWKTASSKDTNSVSENPDYISAFDLHVYTPALNNIGTPLAEVTDDIDGQPRNATTPDIGADEYSPLPIDLGVTSIYQPSITYSQVGSNIDVKVIVKNFGADSIGNFQILYRAGNATPVNHTYTGYLLSNKVDTITFATQLSVVSGPIPIKAYTMVSGDGNLANDTAKLNYFGVPVKGIPYSENFDGSTEEWFKTGGAMEWEKGVPNASVINSAHSSPNVWATVLGGNYINNAYDYLYTPIFNNSVFKADTLKFWFWMDAENNSDGGRIEYTNNGGVDWNMLGNLATLDTNSVNWYNATSVAMWTGVGGGWQQAKYAVSKIPNLGNYVQFRFVFSSNSTNNSYNGWAIDDFEMTLLPISKDAGVIDITNPSASLLGDVVNPTIIVQNFGLTTLTSIPVKYSINNQPPVLDTITTSLAPGATVTHTFNQSFTVTTQPNYTIKAYTNVAGDFYFGSDTTVKIINVSPALKDVGVLSIVSPSDIVFSGNLITVKVILKNFGTNPITSIPVSYQRGTQPAVTDTWTGPALNYGDTVSFSFATTFTVPLGSSFAFSAFTTLAGDAYAPNNKITKSITISSMPANAGSITSASPNGGAIICFPIGSTSPIIATYSVATISNATNYVWNYTGANAVYNDTTTTNSVAITFNPSSTDGSLTVYGYNTLGNGGTSPAFAIDVILNCTVGVDEELADNFWMKQNMPNPANGNTIIEYNIPLHGDIAFEVVNMVGQRVLYFNETKESGKHSINLNATELPDGIYYYSLSYNGKRLVKKMVINN